MAKLHLLIDLNEVTDAEFRALCAALEGKTKQAADAARVRAPIGRNRRDGEARTMRAPGSARRTRPRRAAAAGAPDALCLRMILRDHAAAGNAR